MRFARISRSAIAILGASLCVSHASGQDASIATLDIRSLSQAGTKLSRLYQRSISVEVGAGMGMIENADTHRMQVATHDFRAAISELTVLFDHYVSDEDASTGIINVYPRNGSRLEWHVPQITVHQMSIADVFSEDVFGFKRHGIRFDIGRGNLAWLDHKISLAIEDGISARSLLNRICAKLPYKARWELRSPRAGADVMLLSFHGYGISPIRKNGDRDATDLTSTVTGPKPIEDMAISTTGEAHNIRLTVEVPRLSYRADEPISVTVRLNNGGETDLISRRRSPYTMYVITVKSEDGIEVPKTRYGQRLAAAAGFPSGGIIRIAPGQEHVVSFPVNRMFDMTVRGQYTIMVRRTFAQPDNGSVLVSAPDMVVSVVDNQ